MSCMSMQLLALASSQRVYGRLASLRTSVPQFRRFSSAATTRLNRVPKPRSLTVRMVLTESQDLAVGTVAPDFAVGMCTIQCGTRPGRDRRLAVLFARASWHRL